MAKIAPLRGVLYNRDKVGDLAAVMAPPYDVISPEKQDNLYSRHENNVVRLILGKTTDADAAGTDRYSRAAADLGKWLDSGVLVRDEKPALYYYTQSYTVKDGGSFVRKGFIALARLEEFGKGGIHPHEKTLSGPKADRLKLMQACEANFSCIFSLYSDPQLAINSMMDEFTASHPPLIDVADDDGIANKVWRIDDAGIIEKTEALMDKRALFIADGHHRYETALNFRNYMREKTGRDSGEEPFDYVMMYFSNMDDEGMTIWPTHRVIHSLKDFDSEKFLAACSEYFDIEEFAYDKSGESGVRERFLDAKKAAGEAGHAAFGLHVRGEDRYLLLTIKSADVMDKVFGAEIPEVFKSLDVTVLHSLIFARILGITQESQERQENLIYVKSYDEAIRAANNDANQLVFMLNPTKIEQVKAVAEAGSVMPQKSTYFYPKLLTGLVINLLRDKAAEGAPA